MKIHILGIAGSKTAPLAKILKQQGNIITGSDQLKIFPPISTVLSQACIPLNSTPITKDIDLAIIGNSFKYFDSTRNEFEQIKQLKIPYLSYTQYILQHLIKTDSILVAGTYGKTTITALLAYIFLTLRLDPSYMFGGESTDGIESTRFGNSDWSIVEADENKNGLDIQPTFLYYPVKYLILTSAQWEHKETYPDAESNFNAFKKLVQNLPADGLLIYNPSDDQIQKLLPFCTCQKIPFQNDTQYSTPLIGQHNQQNISAAVTLCTRLGLDIQKVTEAISQFHGTRRRLELISDTNNVLIIDDFAQSATRVKTSLQALVESFPKRRILVFFEPHATFLQNKVSLTGFDTSFAPVSEVVLGKVTFSKNISKSDRVTAADWKKIVGPKLTYLPIQTDVIEHFKSELTSGDILIHFSSGGLDGLNTLDTIKRSILEIHR